MFSGSGAVTFHSSHMCWQQGDGRPQVATGTAAGVLHLRRVRVHEELRVACPADVTVAEVAHRWGFVHLGRFAAGYRARYGETPSETLRKRAGAHR